MNFLKNILGKKDEPINNYQDFWAWFMNTEKSFFNAIKNGGNIERDFFARLSPKLAELKGGFFYLTGMYDDNTAELVLTPDGDVKNIVFVEELVNDAPKIPGWKFTALKPALDIENVNISMADYMFNSQTLSFYSNDYQEYPDEIDITVVHKDFMEENKAVITNGIFIFLDNFLGELNAVSTIDNLRVIGEHDAQKELIPIAKLKDFLIWREKEFLEKYEGIRYDTENDSYSGLEAELGDGKPVIAIVNTALSEWDRKASHPWILKAEIRYNGETNGLPDNVTYELLNRIEDEVLEELRDIDGYLNIGRQTADGLREVYFACKDFRKPSKIMYQLTNKYADKLDITYDIFKDKYWQCVDRFRS